MTVKRRAKRKLTDISFDSPESHIALVSKLQGGPANAADYALVLKGSKQSDEFIEKVSEIKLEMPTEEFLVKFFSEYTTDVATLAKSLGCDLEGSTQEDYEDFIQARMQSFEVMKALADSSNFVQSLAALDETEYLAMLEDQVILEKALLQQTDDSAIEIEDQSVNSTNASVEKSVEPSGSELKQLEKSHMTEEVNKEASPAEMIEKSAFESVQKAFEEQKEKLEKALESIAQFEAEKKAAIAKAKTAQVQEVIKDEARTAVLAKAALALESEDDFGAFVSALKDMMATAEQSDMFVEKGASVSDDTPAIKESAVAKALKAKLNK